MSTNAKVLEDLRRRLLDTGKRNRLINSRFSERSRNHLRIVDELPDKIYRVLIEDEALYFKSITEPTDEPEDERSDEFLMTLEAARRTNKDYLKALEQLDEDDETSAAGLRVERKLRDSVRETLSMPQRHSRETLTPVQIAENMGISPSYELPKATRKQNPAHEDNQLQTLLFPDQLERKLSGISDGARIAFSEMGVNVLFVAFGYLEWYESSSSDKKLLSPLVLHPLQISRIIKKQKYHYTIQTNGEETESNHTLRERIRMDFGFVLPEFDVETDTPESYFKKAQDTISTEKRWKIRRFVTIGLFPFSKIAMYHDLDPGNWPDSAGPLTHPVLSDLLSISFSGDSLQPKEHDVDTIESSPKAPVLIADTDSSQFAAIVDVLNGTNLAIKGPPGTGKSQTITNIIAAALAKGLKVLFVAEKMAALEVVKNRLDKANIGTYCLELHSTKANKKSILKSLSDRLDHRTPQYTNSSHTQTMAELKSLRRELSEYVELLNGRFGECGLNLNEIIWSATKYRHSISENNLPPSLLKVFLKGTHSWTAARRDLRRSALVTFQERATTLLNVFGSILDCPFRGIICANLNIFDLETLGLLLRDLANLASQAFSMQQLLHQELGTSSDLSVEFLDNVVAFISMSTESPLLRELLLVLETEQEQRVIESVADSIRQLRELRSALFSHFNLKNFDRLPNATDLEKVMDLLSSRPVPIPTKNGNIRDFSRLANEYRGAAERLKRLIGTVQHELDLLNLNVPVTDQLLKLLLYVRKILDTVDRDILINRRSKLADEGIRAILKNASTKSNHIKEEHLRLSAILSYSLDDSPELYRAHARTIRGATLLERLIGTRYRMAWRFWRGARQDASIENRLEVSRLLDEVAALLEKHRGFTQDVHLRNALGPDYAGVSTDFDLFLRVNKFAIGVMQALSKSDECTNRIRSLLLSGDLNTLDTIHSAMTDSLVNDCTKLIELCKSLHRESGPVRISELPVDYQKIADWATAVTQALEENFLNHDVDSSNLSCIIREIRELEFRFRELEENSEATRLLQSSPNTFMEKEQILRNTVHVSRVVKELTLPRSVVIRLLTSQSIQGLSDISCRCSNMKETLLAINVVKDEKLPKLNVDLTEFFAGVFSLSLLEKKMSAALTALEHLSLWSKFCESESRCKSLKLAPLLAWYYENDQPSCSMGLVFDITFSRSLMKRAYKTYPELSKFSGTSQEEARRRFMRADRTIIRHMQENLDRSLSACRISLGVNKGSKKLWTDLALIQNEISKKQRHISMRELFGRAGTAIQQMKPCWLMSPSSVAQFLSPGTTSFDLVIIDEASQMLPEDAIGAITRAKQTVIGLLTRICAHFRAPGGFRGNGIVR